MLPFSRAVRQVGLVVLVGLLVSLLPPAAHRIAVAEEVLLSQGQPATASS